MGIAKSKNLFLFTFIKQTYKTYINKHLKRRGTCMFTNNTDPANIGDVSNILFGLYYYIYYSYVSSHIGIISKIYM